MFKYIFKIPIQYDVFNTGKKVNYGFDIGNYRTLNVTLLLYKCNERDIYFFLFKRSDFKEMLEFKDIVLEYFKDV